MSAAFAGSDLRYEGGRHSELGPKFGIRPSSLPEVEYFRNVAVSQLRARMIFALPDATAISILATSIFRQGRPLQIGRRIIEAVAVKVIHDGFIIPAWYERLCDQPVKVETIPLSESRNDNAKVTGRAEIRLEQTPRYKLGRLLIALGWCEIVKGTSAALIRHFQELLKSNRWPPCFVHARSVWEEGLERKLYRGQA